MTADGRDVVDPGRRRRLPRGAQLSAPRGDEPALAVP